MASDANIQIVVAAQDRASKPLKQVEGELLALSKNSRMLKRETRGLSAFANALDTIAGTNFGNTISDLQTVAQVADPLKDIGLRIKDKLVAGLASLANSAPVQAAAGAVGAVVGEAMAVAQSAAATGKAAVQRLAGGIAAMSIPLAAEGTTVGTAVGAAMANSIVAGALTVGGLAVAGKFGTDILTNLFGQHSGTSGTGPQLHGIGFEFGVGVGNSVVAGAMAPTIDFDPSKILPATGNAVDAHFAHIGDQFGEVLATHTGKSYEETIEGLDTWQKSARAITGDLASALQGNTDVIKTAMDKVIWAINHPLELEQDAAKLMGEITMLQYKRGLSGNSDVLNGVLDQQIAVLQAQWTNITGQAFDAGKAAANRWKNGYIQQWSGNKVNLPGYQGGGNEPPPGHGLPHRAMGGNAEPYMTYQVNEGKRAEYLHMGSQEGYISPGAGSQPIQIFLDGRKIFDVVNARLGKKLATTGGSSTYSRG